MAKRHRSLISLSHDHHHGLALAVRLKQGNQALLNDGWTHDRKEQAVVVQRFFDAELRGHFAAEEEVLFPVIRHHTSEADTIVEELKRQHRSLEAAVGRMAGAGEAMLEKELTGFGELLERHIRIEERELFPLFERSVPSGVAAEAGEAITRVHDRYKRGA